tara:strand:+ start:424 stop:672 length:249 start_codon:yes stop_codon:yes gene_type:complete
MKKLLIIGLLLSTPVVAGDTEEPKVVYKKKTEIDFENLDIEGQLVKPQGALLLERKKANFNPLIKLRQDFDVEMSESVKDIQ